ncbi:MAG: hypothetical protein Q9187_005159 [Circinaria calcarea]
MVLITFCLEVLLCGLAAARPQGPNTVAVNNPNLRTMSQNSTWFIIPIPKAAVQSVVPYSLLPVPTSDASLFPSGFPDNAHPVLVSSGYSNDIRMGPLQISSLMVANTIVPYVDRLRDGKTPFQSAVRNWIGGTNGQDSMSVVPGKLLREASKAQRSHPPIPNPISGPGVIIEAIDMDFTITTTPAYTSRTFHALINQVQTLTNGLCQRNPYYFNETFSRPIFTTGQVTLYQPAGPAALAGIYTGQTGYSANAQAIGYTAQDCKTAAAMVDPAALE